jgi:hypothetical protein
MEITHSDVRMLGVLHAHKTCPVAEQGSCTRREARLLRLIFNKRKSPCAETSEVSHTGVRM